MSWMRESRRGTGLAFEALPVAAIVIDDAGRVLSANREARLLSGRAPVVGGSCRDYWGCRLCPSRCPLKRALKTGRPVRRAVINTEGPLGRRTMIERIAPLRLPGGGRGAAIVTGPATSFFRRMRRLHRKAGTDPLTGVLSRGRFEELAERVLSRESGSNAFIMLDVDGLKGVNDRLGHAAGDEILRRLGAVLRAQARRADFAGRLGGDEFAIFCPLTTRAQAGGLIRRLRRAVAAANIAARGPALGVQFGLACGRGALEKLLARADAQLYRRKRENSLRHSGNGSEKER